MSHDKAADVNRSDVKMAEEMVYRALLKHRSWEVEDCRRLHVSWDFRFKFGQRIWTLDVKLDSWFERTDNVVFEEVHRFADGTERPGWGWNTDLDYLAIVGCSMVVAHIVRLQTLRDYITREREFGTPCRWKPTSPWNVQGFHTHGYAIPRSELLTSGVMAMTLPLQPIPAEAA